MRAFKHWPARLTATLSFTTMKNYSYWAWRQEAHRRAPQADQKLWNDFQLLLFQKMRRSFLVRYWKFRKIKRLVCLISAKNMRGGQNLPLPSGRGLKYWPWFLIRHCCKKYFSTYPVVSTYMCLSSRRSKRKNASDRCSYTTGFAFMQSVLCLTFILYLTIHTFISNVATLLLHCYTVKCALTCSSGRSVQSGVSHQAGQTIQTGQTRRSHRAHGALHAGQPRPTAVPQLSLPAPATGAGAPVKPLTNDFNRSSGLVLRKEIVDVKKHSGGVDWLTEN